MSDAAFERDVRAILAAHAPTQAPASLRRSVDELSWRPDRGWSLQRDGARGSRGDLFDALGSAAITAVAVIVVLVLAGTAFFYAAQRPLSPGSGGAPRALAWATDIVRLEADDLVIEAAGRQFRAPADASVTSDPGDATYRTLEMTWSEGRVEMRLNLYLAADNSSWWVREIRTYDGRPQGEWITYTGRFFTTPRGESYEGDVDLAGANARGPGRLRIEGMRLTAFAPGTGRQPFTDCRAIGPVSGFLGRPVASESNPDLSEFEVVTGMQAQEAGANLRRHGICHEFRLEFMALNYSQVWCIAPPGTVRETAFGSGGQVILFVEDRSDGTADPRMISIVGC